MQKIKKILFCMFLIVFSLLFISCGNTPDESEEPSSPEYGTVKKSGETSEKQTLDQDADGTLEFTTSTDEKIGPPAVPEVVETPLSADRLAQIPIANDSMTTDELRKICVDYVCLSVSFQWLPSQTFSYTTSSVDVEVNFFENKLYGGIPYVNKASGNLYRIMEYYDSETGILNVGQLMSNKDYFGTACSGTACWGWQRVINSATCKWTSGMNIANGFIPVGSYQYDPAIEIYGKDDAENCKDIAHRNGKNIMYESYALMQIADCIVNNGHVRMVKEAPVVIRKEDGSIDEENSYVIFCEQGLYTTSSIHDRYTSDGTKYKIQGNDNLKCTFKELYDSGYLPHTFAEFLGTDPVEPAEVTCNLSGDTVDENDFQGTLNANYAISDIFTIIRDANGNTLFRYVKRMEYHFTRSTSLVKAVPLNAIRQYKSEGTNTIEICVQLSTGELVTVYSGTLVAK